MRVGFFIVLFANLAFLGWAHWVDAPPKAPASDPTARLPRLKLVGEAEPAAPAAQGRGAATGSTGSSANEGGSAADTGAATRTSLPQGGQGATGAALAPIPANAARCVAIGPFNDLAVAAKAAGDLRSKGFTTAQRAQEGETWDGFWVYIAGITDSASADQAFKVLDRNGIKDAHLMPDGADGRRISVGLFSDRDRAERRVRTVQKMGLKAEVAERKQPGTQYWVDLSLRPSDGSIPVQDLLAAGAGSGRLSVQSCPQAPATPPPGLQTPASTVAGAPKLP